MENLLYLGKAYLAKGDKKEAVVYLERAVESKENEQEGEEEPEALKEAKALLKKYRKWIWINLNSPTL